MDKQLGTRPGEFNTSTESHHSHNKKTISRQRYSRRRHNGVLKDELCMSPVEYLAEVQPNHSNDAILIFGRVLGMIRKQATE